MVDGFPQSAPGPRAARALSFGAVADLYDRARPGYPAGAVRDLVGPAPADVLDLGAGTGKLTRVVAAGGHRVVAAEPDAGMLAQLRAVLPDVAVHQARAEALPFPDARFDAVVAGQAAHWFDPDRAMPEIARVLRPGGRIGLFWNLRDETVPWIARFGELVGSDDASHGSHGGALGSSFTAPTVSRYEHVQPLTVDGLVDLAHSRSWVLSLTEEERTAQLDEVRAFGESVARGGTLEMRYVLQVWWAVRA